jgi:uncharacterized protein (TIGR03435 family)
MNRRRNGKRNLDEAFGRLVTRSGENMESAVERVRENLRFKTLDVARTAKPARSSRFRPYLLAAAALLVLSVFSIAVLRNAAIEVPAVVETSGGSLQQGQRIQFGETVRSRAGAVLGLADGSHVEMHAGSELSLQLAPDGVRILLAGGSIIVNAAERRKGHLYVQTKDVTVSVVGTIFLVNTDESGSRVAVIQGEVQVRQGASLKTLAPGEQVVTNPVLESVPVIEELAWSRNAAAHLALWEKSLALLAQSPVAVDPPAQAQNSADGREAFEVASVRRTHFAAAGGGRGATVMASGCAMSSPQIDPGWFAVSSATVYNLAAWAYGTGDITPASCRNMRSLNLISGGPGWVASDQWDVKAVIPEASRVYTSEQLRRGEAPKLRRMIRTLLEDGFKLSVRRETREVSAYILTAERNAPRFSVRPELDTPQFRDMWARGPTGVIQERGAIFVKNAPMADFILLLERETGRPILDRTGLTGQFTFMVEYTPLYRIQSGQTPLDGPPIFTALQEQVGLKLESTKTAVQVWVIEHAEKPTED